MIRRPLLLNILLYILVGLLFIACESKKQLVIIQTSLGEVEAEVYKDKAPITATNFLKLVNAGIYNQGASFYRVTRIDNQPNQSIKIDVVQGGLRNLLDSVHITPIPHETTQNTGLKHIDGSLSMARSEPGSASSEFFICIGEQPSLDYGGKRNPDGMGFAVFGKVISGMNIIQQIQKMPDNQQYLIEPIRIVSIHEK